MDEHGLLPIQGARTLTRWSEDGGKKASAKPTTRRETQKILDISGSRRRLDGGTRWDKSLRLVISPVSKVVQHVSLQE